MDAIVEKCEQSHSIVGPRQAIEMKLSLTVKLVVFEGPNVNIFIAKCLASKFLLIVLPLAFEHNTIPFPSHCSLPIPLVMAPSTLINCLLLRSIDFGGK